MKFILRQCHFMSLAILMGLLASLSLAGCGDSTATTNPTTLAATTVAQTSVAAMTATVGATTTSTSTTVAATSASATATTVAGTSASAATTAATTITAASSTTAAGTTAGGDTSPKVVAAATAFLATLDSTQKAAVLFDWSNTAQKARWSNFPQGLFQRAGLMWDNLSDAQKQAWLTLMTTTLSKEGYQRVLNEWNADDALAASSSGGGGGGPGNLQYGKQYYWVALIGTPSITSPWQWQWGGHHVTINATVAGSSISLNPSFIGVQPATYKDASGNTVRPLGDIDDTAAALLNSLDATQKPKAVLGTTSIDLVLGPGQDGKKIASEGLPGSAMTASQQTMLMTLLGYYGNLINAEDAAARMADLKSHLADTYFAWYGSTSTPNSGYFRITGPTVVIEYSPQQMGGNSSEHIHGIYRDPTNDYGASITK